MHHEKSKVFNADHPRMGKDDLIELAGIISEAVGKKTEADWKVNFYVNKSKFSGIQEIKENLLPAKIKEWGIHLHDFSEVGSSNSCSVQKMEEYKDLYIYASHGNEVMATELCEKIHEVLTEYFGQEDSSLIGKANAFGKKHQGALEVIGIIVAVIGVLIAFIALIITFF